MNILTEKRKKAKYLSKKLGNIDGIISPYVQPGNQSSYMMFTIKIIEDKFGIGRDEFSKRLADRGIQTKIYFPPVHKQPIFKDVADYTLPVTDQVSSQVLSLPFHSKITQDDIDYMVKQIKEIKNEK